MNLKCYAPEAELFRDREVLLHELFKYLFDHLDRTEEIAERIREVATRKRTP